MPETTLQTDQKPFFVLDIGTRFVRGLICQALPGAGIGGASAVRIMEAEVIEHETRSMRAGQIHDIDKVSKVVRAIAQRLEYRLGKNYQDAHAVLSKVAVAVAGRNLLTRRGKAEHIRAEISPVSSDNIKHLELMAVQNALESIDTEADYYCVGYTSCGYWLDGEEISSLLDHRGTKISCETLVTLLPRQVLEAMFEACGKADLEIDYLTLEPIAALEATMTEGMRSLDTILVDIGAGTSDIAVMSRGRVQAYGMVPMAGDSLTDALCSDLLMDFNEAERIKRKVGEPELLSQNTIVEFRDIFGRTQQKPARELFAKLRPAVSALAARISEEIKKLSTIRGGNFAVILVGGGSLTPMLEQDMAEASGIAPSRVGKRPVGMNHDIEDMTGALGGPDSATVAGIAMLQARRAGLSLTHLTLNEKRITMVNADRNPTVLSVLLSNGIGIRQIYGRPGLAQTVTLNGELITLKGERPQPASLELNGEKVTFEALVKEGDRLVFFPALDGADAVRKLIDIVPQEYITFNGARRPMPMRLTVSGTPASPEAAVVDRSVVNFEYISVLNEALESLGIDKALADEKGITVEVNGQYVTLRSNRYALRHNRCDIAIENDARIAPNDEIEFKLLDPQWKIEDIVTPPVCGKELRVRINGEERIIPGGKGIIFQNGKEVQADHLLKDGDVIRTVAGKDCDAVMVDVFRYISIDPNQQIGKRMRLLLNDQESQYTTPLPENADIKVLFV